MLYSFTIEPSRSLYLTQNLHDPTIRQSPVIFDAVILERYEYLRFMFSIWERNEFLRFHYIILGGGIVGLSTAYYLKTRFPDRRIAIMERGLIPSGASTRNAGFACMGSVSELLSDLNQSSPEEVCRLFQLRKNGLQRLRSLLGDSTIGYSERGSYELLFAHELEALDQVNNLNGLLFDLLGGHAFEVLPKATISQFGFSTDQVHGIIENKMEGELDTGLMMQALTQLVLKQGIEIKTGCLVESFHEESGHVTICCAASGGLEPVAFETENLLICTNAFASDLLPQLDVVPGRGQVLVTKPIPNLRCRGIFHFNSGYFYFREYKGRILFGGGRHLDKLKEATMEFGVTPFIQENLEHHLRETILPYIDSVEIDYRWSGIMAFGETKKPILERYSNRILLGVRMGGMGVAIGSEIGYQLAHLCDA
jgi:gamma-glutamylputrescine oxidase